MMKILLLPLLAMTLFQQKCHQEKTTTTCYKGKLVVKGICSNYTIALIEGHLDPSTFEASWMDEQTKNTYTNVFALSSPCNFPATIAEGDEFYFTLDTAVQNCAVCKAYYPKPAKALSIRVLDKPCR